VFLVQNLTKKKRLFALIYGTLSYRAAIEDILIYSNFIKNSKLNKELCMLLVYDHLFGKGINCGGKLKKAVFSNKSALNSALVRVKVKLKISENKDLCEKRDDSCCLKYWRINTLKTDIDTVKKQLKENNIEEITSKNISNNQYYVDSHIPNLLVNNSSKNLTLISLRKAGDVISQDKASCMPAFVLNPPPGSVVIDTCSAPGNKTSHLASIMNNTGKIFAFDISKERIEVMKTLLQEAGVQNSQIIHKDFLKVKPEEFNEVKYMLVDPSCSGSGIVNRFSELTDHNKCDKKRLKSLHNFQITILNHALSFPSVEKVVYSTCSIHQEENEDVVLEALQKNPNFKLENILPEWERRGFTKVFPDASKCLRCDPNLDATNCFFVALFVKQNPV